MKKSYHSNSSSSNHSTHHNNHTTGSTAPNNLLSSFRSSLVGDDSSTFSSSSVRSMIPHQGALCRIEDEEGISASADTYVIDIGLEDGRTHDLKFSAQDFDFVQKLFAILDTESRGVVDRRTVKEFVTLRCPVFCRRDDDLRRISLAEETGSTAKITHNHHHAHQQHLHQQQLQESPTFDEVWKSVVESSKVPEMRLTDQDLKNVELGVESWMVFCRFIALAQYLEARRRFSARHRQQTMRHRNSPRGSELVVVDVPPPEPPETLSRTQLANYETMNQSPLPLPELDLDHSLVAAHESAARRRASAAQSQGTVKISLFGSSSHNTSSYPHHHHHHMSSGSNSSSKQNNIEFKVSYTKSMEGGHHHQHCTSTDPPIVVRRSMEDMKWLNDTFTSHKVLGGTLCGRILPPFPGSSSGKNLASQFQRDDTILNANNLKNTTGGAIAAAAAGVEIIKDVAKTLWKSTKNGQIPNTHQTTTLGPSQNKKPVPANKPKAKPRPSFNLALPESYYNPNSPAGRARQVERYLNYLLEHPALSTSFPLNTILKASQSGLEAAKQSLEECLRLSKEMKEQTPQLVDGKTVLPFWGSSSGSHPSLSWVRTAAQAAMALKVHGILETTGMQSASARLQHASLPSFDHPGGRQLDWVDEEQDEETQSTSAADTEQSGGTGNNFEQGVVTVQSELQAEIQDGPPNGDDGYDLLPLPVPAPERRILCAGSRPSNYSQAQGDTSSVSSGQGGSVDSREAQRFHYGTSTLRRRFPMDDEDDTRSAFLGDISVDEHIDKLREVIGSVDNTLSRCLASGGGIGRARRERLGLHLDIVQGFDSWKGLRGKFIGQRALLKGVSGIEQSNEVYEESDLMLIDDLSWQTSLANSAVSAAEDVRSAVRAARTAENAKAAASSAAFAAQSNCEGGAFPTIDEARAAQTRASIAQSHAFHAAVVEHEAKAVKRRATLALAHDVKCWNVHRKREMLDACIAHARSQLEATRRAVDAWSCLRDGFIGSTVIPSAHTRKAPPPAVPTFRTPVVRAEGLPSEAASSQTHSENQFHNHNSSLAGTMDTLGDGVFADLLGFSSKAGSTSGFSNLQNSSSEREASGSSFGVGRTSADSDEFNCIDPSEASASRYQEGQSSEQDEATATIYQDLDSNSGGGSGSKPVIVAVDHNMLTARNIVPAEETNMSVNSHSHSQVDNHSGKNDSDNEDLPFAQSLPLVTAAPVAEVSMPTDGVSSNSSGLFDEHYQQQRKKLAHKEGEEIMSASMQSLVDGLMTWGDHFEGEDVLALPTGMAASIAFEASDDILNSGTTPFS